MRLTLKRFAEDPASLGHYFSSRLGEMVRQMAIAGIVNGTGGTATDAWQKLLSSTGGDGRTRHFTRRSSICSRWDTLARRGGAAMSGAVLKFPKKLTYGDERQHPNRAIKIPLGIFPVRVRILPPACLRLDSRRRGRYALFLGVLARTGRNDHGTRNAYQGNSSAAVAP